MAPTHTRAAAWALALGLAAAGCAAVPAAEPGPTPAPAASDPGAATQQPAPTASDPAEDVTVALTGDMLWHLSLLNSLRADAERLGSRHAEEYGPLFESVRPILRAADVAICHAEVPVVPKGERVTGYPSFGAPLSTMRAVTDLGFDLCTTASNHALDRGFANLVHTREAFDAAGVPTSGTARSATDAERVAMVTTPQGARVAVVGGTYGLNATWPTSRPWAVTKYDVKVLLKRARAARQAGADIVIVNAHAGTEYQHAPSADQRRLARALTASDDVDLVYMHHSHVVQPWQKVNGTWVVYGTSNLVGQMLTSIPASNEGIIARFTFRRDAAGGWEAVGADYVPLLVTHASRTVGARVYAVNDALDRGQGDAQRLEVARKRTARVIRQLGATGITES